MKHPFAPLGLLVLAVATASPVPAAAPGRSEDIRKTTELALRTDAGPNGAAPGAVAHFVVIAGGIAKDAKLAGPSRAKLDAAVEKTARAGPTDPSSAAAISAAYAALNGGRAFAFPPDVKGIDGAKALVRSLSEKSVGALEAGRAEEAARDLLGCVLAITTPMEAGP
ncbi:MAG TPA: hypothetical protein PK598_13555 [Thermoanaerobaculia bacterium]|nr:hypothetical protein [Thermoanaerobaculia bacterium]